GVAVVRLDNPKVNALSTALLGQLEAVARRLTDDPPGAVVVTGGDRIFAAGADIGEFDGPEEGRAVGAAFLRALDAVAAIPRCVLPEILLGIIPGGGGTQRLARLVGPAKAKQLILTGRQVDAAEALAMGLVDEVVPPEQLHDRALALAAELASGAVVAQGLAKRAIDEGLQGSLADGLALEQRLFAQVFETEDARIGIASFREHGPGKARFVGR